MPHFDKTDLLDGALVGMKLPAFKSPNVPLPTHVAQVIIKDDGLLIARMSGQELKWQTAFTYSDYEFDSFTFRAGWPGDSIQSSKASQPSSLSLFNSLYSGQWFLGSAELFNVIGGIQHWRIPSSGLYRITARGACGGRSSSAYTQQPGKVVIEMYLQAGTMLKMLVGKAPGAVAGIAAHGCVGGGGTFVEHDVLGLLCVAGGCGAESSAARLNAIPAGKNGGDAGSLIYAGSYTYTAGAGYLQNAPTYKGTASVTARSFKDGGIGCSYSPYSSSTSYGNGSFGGGGRAVGRNDPIPGGGGGGYVGGDGYGSNTGGTCYAHPQALSTSITLDTVAYGASGEAHCGYVKVEKL